MSRLERVIKFAEALAANPAHAIEPMANIIAMAEEMADGIEHVKEETFHHITWMIGTTESGEYLCTGKDYPGDKIEDALSAFRKENPGVEPVYISKK